MRAPKRFIHAATMLIIWLHAFTLKAQLPVASFSVQGNTSGCAPFTVQFINQSQHAVCFFWDFGNGNTSTLSNPVTVYLQPGSYTVKLVAMSSGGQSDSLIRYHYITVSASPSVNFIATSTSACVNETIQFQNLSQNFISCLWDFGDGTTSTDVSPSHTYSMAGYFTVTLIATNSLGCQGMLTRTQYIVIHPKPVTAFSATPLTYCFSSQPVHFTSSSQQAVSYLWDFGDGQTSTQPNPSHVYSSAGTYTVKLITTSSQGCKDTLIKPNYIQQLDNPVPVIQSNTTSGCSPLWVTLSTPATQVVSYNWNHGNQHASTSFYNQYYVAGIHTVTLTVTYQNGCTNTSQPLTITVLETPNALFSVNSPNHCNQLLVQFNNVAPIGGNSFNWNFGDGNTSSLPNPSHTYNSQGTYTTSLTVTNVNGCSSTYTRQVTITVNPDPTFHTDITTGCPPLPVSFFSHAGTGTVSYLWNFGDGTTSTQAHPTHTYQMAGTYTPSLTVIGTNGCSATYTLPVPVVVAQTTANFVTPPPISACAPFTVSFSDHSFGAVSWLWDFGDGNTSTQQSPTHIYTTPGTYTVSLTTQTNGTGCAQHIPVYRIIHILGGNANFGFLTEQCPPYVAYFHDSSLNAVSWLWNFGDGNTSTQQHPVHTYAHAGTYTVSLTIRTADGCTYTSVQNFAVHFEPLTASPVATTSDSVPPIHVQFYANSQGATGWLWDFGDGTTSQQQNPLHTFMTPPPYNITLTLFNDSCSYLLTFPNVTIGSGSIHLGNDSTPSHSPDPMNGCAPLTLHFYCPVLNTVSWLWMFGDGNSSTLKNPTHTYTTPGLYDITLITTNSSGMTDTLVWSQYILVNGVQASFQIIPSVTCAGNSIQLLNTSLNASVFNWDFGDGHTSTLTNPQHTYNNIFNNYVISLSASDTTGCSAFTQQTFYGVPAAAIFSDKRKICANDTVFFSSINLHNVSFLWDFGNGITSTNPNPYYVYADSGNYQVTLTITDSSGCQQTYSLPYLIEVIQPVAKFTIGNPVHNCSIFYCTFINQSSGATSYLWNYGNGQCSTSVNGSLAYGLNNPGYKPYTVTLTAYNLNCQSSYSLTDSVYIPYLDAGFTYVSSGQCLPVTVSFTDTSRDVIAWFWDFGDGNTSTQQHPVHTYQTAPTHDVKLIITNILGCTDTVSMPVLDAAYAGFTFSQVNGCAPLTVTFNDSSVHAVAWLWDFGNGLTSTLQNPQVTYTQNGYYSIQLTITSVYGCTSTFRVDSAIYVSGPQADFTTTFTAGCAPSLVDFTNLSTHASFWFWDFGDNTYSTQEHPSHLYVVPGNYTVTLIASDSAGCTDTARWHQDIIINGPMASFHLSDTLGCAPLEVLFSNQSVNVATCFWNFGDGAASTSLNPIHTYLTPGQYTVTLMVQDSIGCHAVYVYPDTIHVYPKPLVSPAASTLSGCIPLQVNFSANAQHASHLLWNFGNGLTSTFHNPVCTYTDTGNYQVTLIAYSDGMCHDTSTVIIRAIEVPQADFTSDITAGCSPLTVNFYGQPVSGNNLSYQWSFGNGQTSWQCNPTITYSYPGLYSVSLVVTNEGTCSDTVEKAAYIHVYDTLPPAAPQVLSASVMDDHRVVITWLNVTEPDLYAYHLYRRDNLTGQWHVIYTMVDTLSTSLNVTNSYQDSVPSTLTESYSYRLQTEDRCGNRIALEQLQTHTTINVTAAFQPDGIRIVWTPYEGCSFNEYELLRKSLTGQNWMPVASIPSAINEYIDSTNLCPEEYIYRVRAKDLCNLPFEAYSDTSAVIFSFIGLQHVDILFVTVTDDRYISIEWETPQNYSDRVTAYELYRSEDKIHYHLLATLPPSVLKYEDYQVSVHQENYYYMVIPQTDCAIQSDTGRIGSSILLQSEYNMETERVKLRWTPYIQWAEGVKEYIIQRRNGHQGWETIRTVSGNKTEAED